MDRHQKSAFGTLTAIAAPPRKVNPEPRHEPIKPSLDLNLRRVELCARRTACTPKLDAAFALPLMLKALEERDPVRFLGATSNEYSLWIVALNVETLKSRDMYETTLVHAHQATRTNNLGMSIRKLSELIASADLDRLRRAADLLPDGDNFTLYRGVAGSGADRRVRGFSWSASLSAAAWFAIRYAEHLDDPAVYRTTVSRKEVLWYSDDRHEAEFVVRPQRCTRMCLSCAELGSLAELFRERESARRAAMLRKLTAKVSAAKSAGG